MAEFKGTREAFAAAPQECFRSLEPIVDSLP